MQVLSIQSNAKQWQTILRLGNAMLCKAILELSNPMKPEGILDNSKIPKEQKKNF